MRVCTLWVPAMLWGLLPAPFPSQQMLSSQQSFPGSPEAASGLAQGRRNAISLLNKTLWLHNPHLLSFFSAGWKGGGFGVSPRCRRTLTHSKWGRCPKTPSRAFPAPGAAEHRAAGLVSAKFQVSDPRRDLGQAGSPQQQQQGCFLPAAGARSRRAEELPCRCHNSPFCVPAIIFQHIS